METINPKNFIDIDPSLVSFITLKDGNMIMLDDSAPVKPTKENNKKIEEEENNNKEEKNKKILAVSFPINFSYTGKIKKNIILEISENINFSFNKTEIKHKEKNMPTPNSSIDFKSSMLQSKKDINNLNLNNSNTINKNILSEDNVNIHMTDTLISKQTTINMNNDNKNEEIMPSNNLSIMNNNNNEINLEKKEVENIQAYTFKDNLQNNLNINNENNHLLENNKENKEYINDIDEKEIEKEKENNKIEEKNDPFKKRIFNNNKIPSSLILKNNNFYGRITENQKRSILTEVFIDEEEKNDTNKTYNKINRKIIKNNNYVKAVISINIPGEEKKDSNIVKQFNSLVDRLNGQKSKERIKNIKKSDKFYELYKKSNDNYILDRILSPKKIQKKLPHDYLRDISSFLNNSEMSTVSSGKGSSLNSRILALKERTNPNYSFRTENENSTNEKNDIVLPSNFLYSK